MKTLLKILFFSSFILLFLYNLPDSISRKKKFTYVGYKVCGKCHDTDSIGKQVAIWKKSPHSKAYRTLFSSKAKDIARKEKIKNPEKDYNCLKCHTTGAGKSSIEPEGVGCEACHGPGSSYHEFSNHASFTNRKAAYKKAIRHGMYPIVGDNDIKTRERLCQHCHTLNRPCAPVSSREREKKKLPLSLIADFIFKHPVRR